MDYEAYSAVLFSTNSDPKRSPFKYSVMTRNDRMLAFSTSLFLSVAIECITYLNDACQVEEVPHKQGNL